MLLCASQRKPGRSRSVLATSLFGDVAAALGEHVLATLDEHCGYFRRRARGQADRVNTAMSTAGPLWPGSDNGPLSLLGSRGDASLRFPPRLKPGDDLWVPKTCVTWADVLQSAVGLVQRSVSAGPVLACPEVGGSSACGPEADLPDRVPCGVGAGLVAAGGVVGGRGDLDAAPSARCLPA